MSNPTIDLDEVYKQCIGECERSIAAIRHDLSEIAQIGMTPSLQSRLYEHKQSLSAWIAEVRLCYDSIMSPRHTRLYWNTRRYINYQKRVRKLKDYVDDAAAKFKELRAVSLTSCDYWMQRQLKAEHLINKLQAAMVEIEDASEILQVGDSRYHNMLSLIEIQAKMVFASAEQEQPQVA